MIWMRNLLLIFGISFLLLQAASAMTESVGESTLKNLQNKITPLIEKSSTNVKEEFQSFFEEGIERLEFTSQLTKKDFQAVSLLLTSQAPLKFLCMCITYPLGKSPLKAFREFLGVLKISHTLESLEIKGFIGAYDIKLLSECLGKGSKLQRVSLDPLFLQDSALAPLAQAIQENTTLELTLSGFNPNINSGKWAQSIHKTLERNSQLAQQRWAKLHQFRTNFSTFVKNKLSSIPSANNATIELEKAFTELSSAWKQTRLALLDSFPVTEETCLSLSTTQQGIVNNFDGILLAHYSLVSQKLRQEFDCYHKLNQLSAGREQLRCLTIEIPSLHHILKGSTDVTLWADLDTFLCHGPYWRNKESSQAPLQFVKKWQARQAKHIHALESEHQSLSVSILKDIRHFTEENAQNLLSIFNMNAFSLRVDQARNKIKDIEQEKTKAKSPKHMITEDWLNIKRTDFYRQLQLCFLRNFLAYEGIRLGTFARRPPDNYHECFSYYSPFSYVYFPDYGEVERGEVPGLKRFSEATKLYHSMEIRKKAYRLSTLYNHSFKDMKELSHALAAGILYRYQHQIPYFSEQEGRAPKLAKIIAGQVLDYVLTSEGNLPSLEEMVIHGTLHFPPWLKREDEQGKLDLARRSWIPSDNTLTFSFGKTINCQTETEREIAIKRNIPQLLRLSGICTEDGRRFKPSHKDHQTFTQACAISEDNPYRYGTEAEVLYLRDTLDIPFEEVDRPNAILAKAPSIKEEGSHFISKAKAYVSRISTDFEDLLDGLKK